MNCETHLYRSRSWACETSVSFGIVDKKKLPGIVDCFGWCTWDAFYQEVTQEGVEAGIQSLARQHVAEVRDHRQRVAVRGRDDGGSGSLRERPTGIRENAKFRNKEEPELGIKNIVDIAKRKHGVSQNELRNSFVQVSQLGLRDRLGHTGLAGPTARPVQMGFAIHFARLLHLFHPFLCETMYFATLPPTPTFFTYTSTSLFDCHICKWYRSLTCETCKLP
ncbi:hypothetical protein Fmac_002754 [Flemingia macrophylla]|uniref:Uncharacterized protein n=1 Tax=Flemingia macrophylla TaxID=520843 RepID=A0ABD1NKW3_9FABA